jgi:DNA-binding CsgD family transcriptional regulator
MNDGKIDRLSCKYIGRIREALRPLKEGLGINYFYFSRVTNEGFYSTFSNNPDWNRYWIEEKLYLRAFYFLQPQYFRIGTVVCLPSLENEFKDVGQIAREKFNINHVLEIVTRDREGVESFGFSTEKMTPEITTHFLSDLSYLKLFFKHFRATNGELFHQLKDYQFNLGEAVGSRFFAMAESIPKSGLGFDFLPKIGISMQGELSRREKEICRLLIRGLTAYEVAEDLDLSRRTVEHYIENIKIKLNSDSKATMVQVSLDLEAIGYFDRV